MIFRNRWWQHLLFLMGVFLILLNIFRTSSSFETIDLVYTAIFLVPLAAITYLNLYLFIPRLLRKERYLLYFLLFLMLAAAGALFLYRLFDRWIDLVLPRYFFISYYSVPQLMIYTASVLSLATLLKLSRSWFKLLRVERVTTGQQLKSLHAQINPHFLLNSIQSIYALSLEKSDQAPEVILRLSDILKYTLYETENHRIPLKQEIALVTDYVEMYRLRVDPHRAEILLDTALDPGQLTIAPMLLIPFVENGFKHGLSTLTAGGFVHIRLAREGNRLHFSVKNNAGTTPSSGNGPSTQANRPGIGIENTRQRLDLLYPGKHRLHIQREEDLFHVQLTIQLEP
jgi:sensor histidine kinase YesM